MKRQQDDRCRSVGGHCASPERVEQEHEAGNLCGCRTGDVQAIADGRGLHGRPLGRSGQGPHGAFTKFEPGYDAGMHTHTSDVWLFVIKGAYLYKDEAGEKRVGPGDFMRIRGGHKLGVAVTRRKARSFIRKGRGNSILLVAK
jgi:hypothetical protein